MSIHPLADVKSTKIGEGTQIWQFAIVLENAVIGKNCNINCHTFLENDVIIGDNVTVKSGTYLWDSIRIADNVFIGPGVMFTNDILPRSKKPVFHPITYVDKGASIGANSTILSGLKIGAYSMIGMGSVITHDVPAHALVYGNPAQIKGWVDRNGKKLKQISKDIWESETGSKYSVINSILLEV